MTATPRSRRDDILGAAEFEFAAAGYAGARMDRIAASAGVNKQLLFHYFESKDGLFAAALDNLLRRLEPAVMDDDPLVSLRRVTRDIAGAARAAPGLIGILADAGANAGFPAAAADLIGAWRARLLGRLRALVAEGQRRGYFRDDIDPAEVGAAALASALGAAVLPSAPDPETLMSLVGEYCAWR